LRIADFKKAENRDSPVGAAFPDLSLSKVSRDLAISTISMNLMLSTNFLIS
jgi:hypothetical protein